MKWERARRSDNVEDRRGSGGMRMGGGLGIGGLAIVALLVWLMGGNPLQLLGSLEQAGVQTAPQDAPSPGGDAPAADDPQRAFVASILGDTEDVWGALFKAAGSDYPQPRLVLFEQAVRSACGMASSAVGPFYCPGDQNLYIDLRFFEEMRTRLGGGGDFAQAYVIAHEVGHHVQALTGVSGQVDALRRRGQEVEGDGGPLVRLELQADCYAGVWAHHAQARHQWLEPGDIEEALDTATAIGDDTLQRRAQGQVMPDAFSHGTSAQRVRWFRRGFDSGQVSACDTFSAQTV
jgi:predicted metalloprotease